MKRIKYGEPCPNCGLSWNHGSVKCEYKYPDKPMTTQTDNKERKTISEILIKWGMSTRQKAISEIYNWHLKKMKERDEKLKYALTDVLAEDYINGFDAVEIAEKVYKRLQLKK